MAVRKNMEVKYCWGIEGGVLVWIVRMILLKNKKGIARWKLSEVEERILVEIAGMIVSTNRVVEMKEHLSFCKEFSILCIEDRVVVDHVV